MTKQDYEKFAAIIHRNLTPRGVAQPPERVLLLALIAEEMAAVFEEDNPKFNRNQFKQACGLNN